jgi:hypothetical protein
MQPRGIKSLLNITRRSTVWCYDRAHANLNAALQAYIDELKVLNDPTVLSVIEMYKSNQTTLLAQQMNTLIHQIKNSSHFRGLFGRCILRRTATTEEASNVEQKIKKIIENLDPFKPFRPLMIPLSGVVRMCLLTRGDQKILCIGELHGTNFCTKKGYTPLSAILPHFFESSVEPVDFMLEMSNVSPYEVDDQARLAKECVEMSKKEDNEIMPSCQEKLFIIDLVRQIVQPLIPTKTNPSPTSPYPNVRVHWLQGVAENELEHLFEQLVYSTLASNASEISHVRYSIDQLLITKLNFTPAWSLGLSTEDAQTKQDEERAFLKSTKADKIEFLKACYEALRTSKFLKKCYGNREDLGPSWVRQAPPSWDIYADVFFLGWKSRADKTIYNFYFWVQRFFVDMYTCCRIMKQDPIWFKNIVIYAGDWHVVNYIRILSKLGYEQYDVPVKYNPWCKADLAGGRKRTKRVQPKMTG